MKIVAPQSWPESIAAHLVPGVLTTVVYVLSARLLTPLGLPPPFALFLAMLVVLIPYEVGALVHASRGRGRRPSEDLIPYQERLPLFQYAVLVPILLAWAFFCFFGIAEHEKRFLSAAFSPWTPEWLAGAGSASASKTAWIATLVFGLVVNGLAGPLVEELYFRGYLLPRIPCSRRWSPLLNTVLFSLYHFFSPWQNLSRVLAIAPIAYVVTWKRSVSVGIAVHCLLNTIAMLLALRGVLG
jgi:membrane protease YdiL (CAAX protease family)